jgi:GNAT superfamily N-acetyltransferase
MIRPAVPEDVPEIVAMVRELAEYEKVPQEARATEEQFHAALFAPHPAVFAHVAEDESGLAGFAAWFVNFSTWRGVHGIWLEDLYVRPDRRGGGHGRALLAALAAICVERDYHRLEWSVLDWNEPSIGFYRSLGAVPLEDWTNFRLTGEPLARLGGS